MSATYFNEHPFFAAGATASYSGEFAGVTVAAKSRPAYRVGGDFCALSLRDDHSFNVIVGDLCGKGAAAARVMARLAPNIKRILGSRHGPAELLKLLNVVAWHQFSDHMFATVVCAQFHTDRNLAYIANAGHIPPIRLRGQETCLCAPASAPPLGVCESINVTADQIRLQDGDTLLFMTDGILESIESDLINMPVISSYMRRTSSDIARMSRKLLARAERSKVYQDDATLMGLRFAHKRTAHTTSSPLTVRGP